MTIMEPMETPLDAMGQSLDVPVSALPFLGLGGTKSDTFEFLGLTEEDAENLLFFIEKVREEAMNKEREFSNGGLPSVKKSLDFLKEVNREFLKKQKPCSIYGPTVAKFTVLGFSIPKRQRSYRGKPLIATSGTGFLNKFGAPVLRDFETRFSDADLVESKRNKSQKRRRQSEESEDEKLNKPKRQKDGKIQNNRVMAQLAEWGLVPQPSIPSEFKNVIKEMGGSHEKLLIQKIIFKTDLSKSHNRLQIPENQVMAEFLTEEEERMMDKPGLNVELIEPSLKKSTIHLTRWNMRNSRVFVFNEQWNSVVEANKSTLKKNAVVQIWSFRTAAKSNPCFAMIKVRDGTDY